MTKDQKIIRAKAGLLELAKQLGNVCSCLDEAPGRGRSPGPLPVLCVKFCKGGHGYLGLCGLAEDGFLMLSEIVHVEVAVGFEPVFMGLDG